MKVTSAMSPPSLLLSTAITALVSHEGLRFADAQFQSGPHSGAVFAASMVSDDSNTFLAGVTYSDLRSDDGVLENPQCFVMDFESKDYQYFSQDSDPGNACRAMTILSDQQIMVVGTSNPGGLYFDEGNADAVQVGFGMTLNRNSLDIIAGASLFSDSQVPYPEAVVVDPSNPDIVYVASMTSRETTNNDFPETEFPNWTHLFRHGTHFEMTVEALRYEQGSSSATFDGILDGAGGDGPVISSFWNQHFPVEPEADGSKLNVYVGGMIYKEFVGLIVAGSTAAQGEAYGPSEGDDEDGYISILDPATGELSSEVKKNNQRFGTAEYDVVTNICDDPDDEDYFYIVGGTKGDMDGMYDEDVSTAPGSQHAFVRKVYVPSLFEEWTAQHGAWLPNEQTTKATMWGCIVRGSTLYAVGIVEAGASMIQGSSMHTSKGGNDVFVIAYDKQTGDIRWMNQVGSTDDEQLARNGAIALDASGNVMIYGDTLGSIYRSRDAGSMASDLFHFTMNGNNGSYEKTLDGDTGAVTEAIPGISDDAGSTNGDSQTNGQPTSGSETPVPHNAQVHQGGPNAGAMFASSMVYDAATNEAIITGISYTADSGRLTEQPNCLVARIEINSMITQDYQILGDDDDALEACRDIATNGSDIVVVGNSEPGGIFANDKAIQTGFAFTLNTKGLKVGKGASLFGGDTIPYPQAVVVEGRDVYVASMNSNDLSQNANREVSGDFPNWTHLNKYGQGFVMSIEKLSLPNYNKVWQTIYPVDKEADGSVHSVHVGGLIQKIDPKGRKVLVVVGSTRAKGEAYGPADGSDADGYITLIDPSNGELMSEDIVNNIRIGSAADDVISEICDVPDDDNAIVVVGATKGDIGGIRDSAAQLEIPAGSLQWFAMKINLTTLRQEWTIQGGAVGGTSGDPTTVFASGCHVDKDNVFVGGNVENGASVQGGSSLQTSKGGNDVWVAALNLSNGNLNWISQIGSAGDDGLARNGGISTNARGDVIVFGDTTGGLFRDRQVGSNADIFLAVLQASSGHLGKKSAAMTGTVDISNESPPRAPPRPSALDSLTNDQKKIGAIVGFVILGLIVVAFAYYLCQRCCRRRRRRNLRAKAPTNIYDAAAADLGYEDTPSSGNDGLFRKKNVGISMGGTNFTGYKDDPESDAGAMGNFHKTYSDLPEKGKEII